MPAKLITAGADHEALFHNWCVPTVYACAQTITVAVFVKVADAANDVPGVDLSGVFATASWGGDAADVMGCGVDCQSVDFDCVGGSAICVEATCVTVEITYPGPVDATHPPIQVDVSFGVGSSGKAGIASSAQRTIFIGAVGAGIAVPAQQIPIPPWAVGAILINTDPVAAAPSIILQQWTSSNPGILVSAAPMGKRSVDVVPIARGRGARYFNLLNVGQTNSPGTAVIFCLAPN